MAAMAAIELITSSGLGSLLGMRHALEPDHLAAVSTLVTGERSSAKAALLGMCWGVGRRLSLVVVGSVLVLLRAEMPARVGDLFELCVALMLIGLGLRAIYLAARQGRTGPARAHQHGQRLHVHPGAPAHIHIGAWTLARRPLLVGAVHGLAGSGALTALVLATLPSAAARLTYMTLFGVGSTMGMTLLSGLVGLPLARVGGDRRTMRTVSLVVGFASTPLGIAWGFPLIGCLIR